MENIAIITYNCISRTTSFPSGWHERNGRKALLLQNTKGEGSWQDGQIDADRRREQVRTLWDELRAELPKLDHVVVYVGANGSQSAIALAAQLSPAKVTFVGCDCGLLEKEVLVRAAGMGDARRLLCECGGHVTLERMFHRFLESGELISDDPS
ncbi:hypothetical protein A3E39_04185 [Candidatus Uhrbacteria bacterium RIFCSPHIGHO2_12_FULL_60_25]|uniref:Uncharacterized protein n=1 Tax=Candidatus Uhrbacteria bacterium RIFCSPHIGHO2_12_FULL_60_25 TaxID=1802399 RepID=A0A1F7ULH3_9BACT|nr:MAG: hypothetical protein A3D73_01210 [Candidatus Uhrbacteria bacterium RIFCSPHIGHO2_02_FULL_60_44]OGL79133.1 MAG: hypothetical protein A3E39_04185 [Candidatus Uhrbacteria bacterium RIFCSPHIGHO2_12_FULL_60_25]